MSRVWCISQSGGIIIKDKVRLLAGALDRVEESVERVRKNVTNGSGIHTELKNMEINTNIAKSALELIIKSGEPDLIASAVNAVRTDDETKCRVCGCGDSNPCEGGCYWIEPDLCSKCEGKG